MNLLLKTLAILCAVLFVLAGVVVLLLFNIERKVFVSSTYKLAFEEQRLYERMPGLLATALHSMIAQNPGSYPFLKELTAQDWQSTIGSLLPPEELRAVADSALDSTFDYVNGKADVAVISLVPIKARLVGQSGVDIVTQFLGTQPACTIEQLQQMALGFLGGNIALCNPPPEAIGLVAPFIQSQMQTVTASFPDQVTIISSTNSGSQDDPRTQLHLVRSAVRFSPYFVFLLLLTIVVFAVRSLRDLLIWWGWPLSITGAAAAVIALVGTPLVSLLLQFLIQTRGAALIPPLFASTIAEAAGGVAKQVLSPVILQGSIIACVGVMFLVLAVVVRDRRRVEFLAPPY